MLELKKIVLSFLVMLKETINGKDEPDNNNNNEINNDEKELH